MYILSKHRIVLHKYILNVPIIFKSTFLPLDESSQPDLWFVMNNSHHMAVLCLVCSSVFANNRSEPKTGFQKEKGNILLLVVSAIPTYKGFYL